MQSVLANKPHKVPAVRSQLLKTPICNFLHLPINFVSDVCNHNSSLYCKENKYCYFS